MTTNLAIDGGAPHVTVPLPGSLQGVLEIGQAEIDAVTAVLRRGSACRAARGPARRTASGRFRS